jgi:hypothetical protein
MFPAGIAKAIFGLILPQPGEFKSGKNLPLFSRVAGGINKVVDDPLNRISTIQWTSP